MSDQVSLAIAGFASPIPFRAGLSSYLIFKHVTRLNLILVFTPRTSSASVRASSPRPTDRTVHQPLYTAPGHSASFLGSFAELAPNRL